MHTVSLDGREKQVAANWNELSRPQLLALMPVFYGRYADANRQRIEALWVLLGISPALGLRITAVQYCQILWLADFLFAGEVGLTAQLLPWVRLPRRIDWFQARWWGPAAGLANVRFLEFVFADAYFVAYARSQEERWLDRFLAVLYRPQRAHYRPTHASYAGDPREDFNENVVAHRAQQLQALGPAERLAALTWYRGCRHALELRYPLVFTPAHEAQATQHTDGWAHVLREMSGAAFGSFEETGRQHLHTVLAKMEDDTRRAQEMERRAKAQQSH